MPCSGARWGFCARAVGLGAVLLLLMVALVALSAGPMAAWAQSPAAPARQAEPSGVEPSGQAPPGGATGPGLAKQRAQMQRLGQEREHARQQLQQIQASESELRSEIEQLSTLVAESHRRKEALEDRIQSQQALARQQAQEAQHLQDEIKASKVRIGQRLRRLYRLAKQGHSALLFQMARFQTFAKDTRYLALLQDSDLAAIARYEELGRQLAAKKQQVEESVQRLLALQTELDDETKELSDREAYLQAAIADTTKNRAMYKKYLADVEQMMARMEQAVTRMEQAALAEAAPPVAVAPEALRGNLPAPVQGRVIAAFGAQDPRYDMKKLQRGIVIRVAPRAPVKAVAAGRAVHAGPFRGYQDLVVLDHGQGLFTVYGHLQDVTIKRGDWVRQGTELGVATYQPVDDAYDVYFEIRNNGTPANPLTWLKAGSLSGPVASAGK